MAALDRTFALAKMHHIAMAVGNDLHLDVTRLAKIAFQIDGIITECRLCLGAGRAEGLGKVISGLGNLHAATPATRSGLDQQRIADIAADALCLIEGWHGAG